jgi:hypothetical protein
MSLSKLPRCAASLLVSALAASCFAQDAVQSETLLLRLPEGFKVGYQRGNMTEWVPSLETVEDWSELVTLSVYKANSKVNQVQFLQGIASGWMQQCPETPPPHLYTGQTNGYAVSMMLLACPKLKSTGKPETTGFRAIQGTQSLYIVQRAFRSTPTQEQVARTMSYLGTVTVCDRSSLGHPCPGSLSAQPPASAASQ